MIGLMFLAGLAIWLVLAVWISKRILGWMGNSKYPITRGVAVFLLVLIAPVADELIGRWQFHQLCEREAVVTLSPDWEMVKRAKGNEFILHKLPSYLISIEEQPVEFIDADTGKLFLTYKGFRTKGGVLMSHGLGLGGTTSCWPKDKTSLLNKVNIDQLLKQGK